MVVAQRYGLLFVSVWIEGYEWRGLGRRLEITPVVGNWFAEVNAPTETAV